MDLPHALGPYRVLRRLGRGGMADVLLAKVFGASGFEKLVALKTLLPELRGRAELEKLLIEEARLGARLSHRNLVGMHDLGVEDGIYYVRMDYVDGADLATLQLGAPLEPSLALVIAEEVALALDYVHGALDAQGRPLGLVHRDVSPHNVLLSRSGEVKLGDFGIAKATHLAEQTQANLRRGKYAYMSPEQIDGAPLTSRSDQFGFGVLLYELLRGVRPFDGDSLLATMDRIRLAHPPDLSALEEDLSAILRRALARDPSDRFGTTEHLVRALAEGRRRRTPCTASDVGAWVRHSLEATARGAPLPPHAPTRPLTD